MPVDPRIQRYMQENGYKDLSQFPEPSQMMRIAKSPNPAINITRGLMSAVEQLALAGIKKKATNKNEEAAKKTEERISAEDQMQFRAKIDQLKQNGFEDLATAAEITGELPNNAAITKAMADRQKQQEDQQTEQIAMSPIQAAQQAAQMRIPADQTPMLSKDFQEGFPSGPSSMAPQFAQQLAKDTGMHPMDVVNQHIESGFDLNKTLGSLNQPTPDEIYKQELLAINQKVKSGEISQGEGAYEASLVHRRWKPPQVSIAERQGIDNAEDRERFMRSDEAYIRSSYQSYVSDTNRKLATYDKQLAAWEGTPKAFRSKEPPKPPETVKDQSAWMADNAARLNREAPLGYKSMKQRMGQMPPKIRKAVDDMISLIEKGEVAKEAAIEGAKQKSELAPYLEQILTEFGDL